MTKALSATTISASGLDITIACDDHDTKDEIFDFLERLAALSVPPGDQAREAVIEECAKVADDFAAYEQAVVDRIHTNLTLSEADRKRIASSAGSRQVAAEQIAHDIRALASEVKKP